MFPFNWDIGCYSGHIATLNNVGLNFGSYRRKAQLGFTWKTNNVTSKCLMMKAKNIAFLALGEGCIDIDLVCNGVS